MKRETSYRVNPIFLLLPIPKGKSAHDRGMDDIIYFSSTRTFGAAYKTAIFELMLYIKKL